MIGVNISGTTDTDRNYDLTSNRMVWAYDEYVYLAWDMIGPQFEESYAPKLKIGRFNPTGEGSYHDILTEVQIFGRSGAIVNFEAYGYYY